MDSKKRISFKQIEIHINFGTYLNLVDKKKTKLFVLESLTVQDLKHECLKNIQTSNLFPVDNLKLFKDKIPLNLKKKVIDYFSQQNNKDNVVNLSLVDIV